MTRKEKNTIIDRLEKLQARVDYNMCLYRLTGNDAYNEHADTYRAMLYGARGIAIELGLVGEESEVTTNDHA